MLQNLETIYILVLLAVGNDIWLRFAVAADIDTANREEQAQ